MTWAEAAEALKETDIVIIPTGATEAHGLHRPLGDDAYIATEFACRIARKLNPQAVVAPTIPASACETLSGWTGTINIRGEVFREYVKDFIRSLHKHGWKRVIIMNTHGGNRIHLQMVAGKMKRELPGLQIIVVPSAFVGPLHDVDFVERELGLNIDQVDYVHGGEFQTSVVMAIEKKLGLKLVHKDKAPPPPPRLHEYRRMTDTGPGSVVFIPTTSELAKEYTDGAGVFYKTDRNKTASAEKGEVYLEKLSTYIAGKIQTLLKQKA
jgi:creatinine amidohydrolase